MMSEVEELKAKLEIAIGALKFYADVENWECTGAKPGIYASIVGDDFGNGSFDFNDITNDEGVGGKLARETLAKIIEVQDEQNT